VTVQIILLVLLSIAAALSAAELLRFGLRRRRFGRVLWSVPGRSFPLWFVPMFFALELVSTLAQNGKNPQHLKALLFGALALISLFKTVFAADKFCVYERGVSAGAFTVTWSELTGWAFGTEGKWSGRPPEVHFAPTHDGPSHLYLWSHSFWQFLNGHNPRQPVKASVQRTEELVAIMRAHAPELSITKDDTNPANSRDPADG
jgi:hypothetical protein